MSKAVIIGGSVAGLASALALSELGYDIEILERDPNPPPGTAEEAHWSWPRPTVPQAVHSHAFGSLGCNLLRERAPDVFRALVAAGAPEIQLGEAMPPTLEDRSPEPDDAELLMLACRRSTFELILRQQVAGRPRVVFRHGATVRGLELAPRGAARVVGVRTQDGSRIGADLVIDAAGRRSAAARWLADAAVRVDDSRTDSCDITYYTRFYRLLTDRTPGPLNRGFGAGGLWDHYTAVLFLGDNQTFSISIGVLPDDRAMKALRREGAFTAALRATPLLAPWIEPGVSEPISDVQAMAGLDNSLQALGTTRQSPVHGLFHIGDSVCTTNPAYGRGVSLALAHAFRLADVLAANPAVGERQTREMAEATERLMSPWFHEAVQNDRGRARLWRATVAGTSLSPPPDGVVTFGAAAEAAATDPVVWRRLVRVMMSLTSPASLYDDDEIRLRVKKAQESGGAPKIPAPSREELLHVVESAS